MSKRISAQVLQDGCRILQGYGYVVQNGGDVVQVFGSYQRKGFSFLLEKSSEGLKLVPPTYKFRGVNSHFDFKDVSEMRYYKNKQVIRKIVKALRGAGLWSHLVNPDFFIPNTGNTRMDRRKVDKEYKELLSEVED